MKKRVAKIEGEVKHVFNGYDIARIGSVVYDKAEVRLALLKMVEELEDRPVMDDLVSRQAAVSILMQRAKELAGFKGDIGGACAGAAKLIKSLPSAEPKTGHAETASDGNVLAPTVWAVCSECKEPIDPWDKYCRHCGTILASEVIGGEE